MASDNVGIIPNPPWQETKYDNGAKSWLNEQPPNAPPVTKRILYIVAANGNKLEVDLSDGSTKSGDVGW